VLVAKHGNRSRTGRGSAEILAALGVNVDATPAVQARCLRETGVCFCFAIHHHPAMRFAGPARRALPHPTIFNALGPMTNPAAASRQLIGVYDPLLVSDIAQALARLGATHAIIAHSHDGLDELSITAPTTLAIVRDGEVRTQTLDATTLGLPRASLAQIQAVDLNDAARIFKAILDGHAGPHLDMVLLNAAAALIVAHAAPDWASAVSMARTAVASGAAQRTLAALAACSSRPE
jgi:anthranilate phosphoribosyltransferase